MKQFIHKHQIHIVLLLICIFAQPVYSQPIDEIEALHLVEMQVSQFRTDAIRCYQSNGIPYYEVTGKCGSDGYQGIVHAQAARLLSITKNGQPFYKWEGVKAVGHRGNIKFAPENTIPAFKKAIQLGADLLEIDVRETKDGHLVIMHDPTVNRTTNGSGKVTDLTLAEIKQLDAGSWFSPEFKGTSVPTFDEALEFIKGKALPDIDFKTGTPEKVIATVKKHGMFGKCTLYCGNWDLLQKTMQLSDNKFFWRPGVPIGAIGLPILLQKFDAPIVNIDWGKYSPRLMRDIHTARKKSFMNTMGHDTEWAIKNVIETLPDYIQSDHMEILIPMLRAKGLHD